MDPFHSLLILWQVSVLKGEMNSCVACTWERLAHSTWRMLSYHFPQQKEERLAPLLQWYSLACFLLVTTCGKMIRRIIGNKKQKRRTETETTIFETVSHVLLFLHLFCSRCSWCRRPSCFIDYEFHDCTSWIFSFSFLHPSFSSFYALLTLNKWYNGDEGRKRERDRGESDENVTWYSIWSLSTTIFFILDQILVAAGKMTSIFHSIHHKHHNKKSEPAVPSLSLPFSSIAVTDSNLYPEWMVRYPSFLPAFLFQGLKTNERFLLLLLLPRRKEEEGEWEWKRLAAHFKTSKCEKIVNDWSDV